MFFVSRFDVLKQSYLVDIFDFRFLKPSSDRLDWDTLQPISSFDLSKLENNDCNSKQISLVIIFISNLFNHT